MLRSLTVIALVAALFCVFSPLRAAELSPADVPFGFAHNVHPSEYGYCSGTQTDDVYLCTTSPKPHSAFENYLVVFMRGIGLCKIVAIGKTIENDRYGGKSRDKADEIARQIGKKYGAHTEKLDFLLSGSLWDESRYWMMGVDAEDRYYSYWWSGNDGYKKIFDVAAIAVQVRGSGSRAGYVTAAFEFTANSRCAGTKDDADSDAF